MVLIRISHFSSNFRIIVMLRDFFGVFLLILSNGVFIVATNKDFTKTVDMLFMICYGGM